MKDFETLTRLEIEWLNAEGVCWCRGNGFRRFPGAIGYVSEFCTCPAGRAAKLRAMLRWAEIPARFVEFTLDSHPSADRGLIERMKQCGATSWFLWGDYGTGKTGLAVGLVRFLLEQDLDKEVPIDPLFVSVPRMLQEIKATYAPNARESEEKVINRFARCPFLVLDDIGAEHVSGTGWAEDRLYQIVGERHAEMRPTVFTSNLAIRDLAARIGERIVWRIVEMVGPGNIVHVTGPNLRDRGSDER